MSTEHDLPPQEGEAVTAPLSPMFNTENAKSYLLKASTTTGLNLYDHLAQVLLKVLTERPDNAVDVLEDVSRDEKRAKCNPKLDAILDKPEKTSEVALAEIQNALLKKEDDEEQQEEEIETPLPNLVELFFFFEQAGVGLSREEIVRIWLALKRLVDTKPLQHVRFWGKIIGTEQNYIIAEAEYREGEEEEEEEEEEETPEEEEKEEEAEEDEEAIHDEPPKPQYKAPPDAPKEENRTGVNKKTYFVCNEPGKDWIKLPAVTPKQIAISRKIRKFFTGRLDAPIVSYPPFPGNESNYLRAQISRISAGTHISPQGYYQFDEEEEEEEEGAGRENFVENVDFEGVPSRELVDIGNWVHHVQHILPQGRCTWWNPTQKGEEEYEDEDEEEEREEPDEAEPEQGPPLLTPISEDIAVDGTDPWTGKLSSKLVPQYAIASMRSNLWPGATAFGFDKKFENVYIGWGHKFTAETYSPPQLPPLQEEFPSGQEITEADDPTPEEEAAFKASQQVAEEGEEEGEEEEDGAEDEDD